MWVSMSTHTHTHTHTQETPLKGDVELRESPGEVFALISAEFAFGYGMFGYGESCHVNTNFQAM